MLILTLLLGCAERCDLAATAAEVAGPDAIDCGHVEEGADGTGPWGCAVDALDASQPFYLRSSATGIDSSWDSVVAYDGDKVWLLRQDTAGVGVGNPARERIDGYECVNPTVEEADGSTSIECSSVLPENNHYQVCGDCGGCVPDGVPWSERDG